MLANGAETPFFLSGQTYYEVINASVRNNAYYILAQQYIAAELNQLRGADVPPEVLDAFDQAKDLFSTYSPDDLAGLNKSDPVWAQFVDLAYILDQYNKGEIGPGHCYDMYMSDLKSASLGINPDDELSGETISYYPNPVNDVLYIVTNKNFRINVFSSSGRLLIDKENEKSIDMSHFESGLYLLRIVAGDKVMTDKITKY
jgi:hypothetical protein